MTACGTVEARIQGDSRSYKQGSIRTQKSLFRNNTACLRPLLLVIGFFVWCAALPAQTIVVSAAASLKEALTDVDAAYSAKHPGVKIDLNLAGSGALQQQIEQGAPVDVFISAAAKQMDQLVAKGFILDGSVRNLLENQIVLIGPAGATRPESFAALANPSLKHIAIGEPTSVPAGQYALQIFEFYHLMEAVKPRLVFGKDVRMVLTYVETGNADCGLVYLTDARQSGKVAILATAPPESHDPVVYSAAVIKGTKQPAAAGDYLDFLQSPEASVLFEKRGFRTPATPER